MHFPNDREVIRCPHCKGQCAYGEYKPVEWQHRHPGELHTLYHFVHVLHCLTCGNPMIRHSISTDPGRTSVERETIYPSGPPARDQAPVEIRNALPELARDYNEAVACEPHSLQAVAILLGRCVEYILVAEVKVDPAVTLGRQITEAITGDKFPEPLKDSLKRGFLIARNQAGHVWKNAAGDVLKVNENTVERCFAIVDQLFEHFYITPRRSAAFIERMNKVKGEKT